MRDVVEELIRLNHYHQKENANSFLKEKGAKLYEVYQNYLLSDIEEKTSDKAWLMVRKELVHKLVSLVPFIDVGKLRESKYYKDFFNTLRDLYVSRILLSIGLYSSGQWLLSRTIKMALKLEIWDVVLSGSNILSSYYAIRQNKKSYEVYCAISDHSIEMIIKEQKLKRMLNKWVLNFSLRRKTNEETIELLRNDIESVEGLIDESDPIHFSHLIFRLKLIYFDALMDYRSALKICEEAKSKILSKTGYTDHNKFGIYHGVQMYCYLNLKEFSKANDFAKNLGRFLPEGTLNWYIFMEYYYVLTIQSRSYEKAYSLYEEITASSGFKQLKGVRKDVWSLLTAYMQFLIISRIWKKPKTPVVVADFRINKFINEVFKLGSDKTGLQVSVLILQILFLLQQQNYSEIIERKEPIRRYVYRYLYSKENERSRLFLTMLLRMVESEFSYALTKEKTKRLFKLLQNQEMNYIANLGGNEIVDYELLWGWVLSTLKKNWSTAVA